MRLLPLILLIIILITPVVADDDFGDESDEDFEEIGEGTGGFAVFLLFIGSAYILLRRLYVWSRNWGEDREETKELIFEFYRNFRKPLLIFHNVTMITATVVAAIHGVVLIREEESRFTTGLIALVAMVLLCISGLIMYYKFRPIWDNRSGKDLIRFLHRQWIISVVLVIGLILHIA